MKFLAKTLFGLEDVLGQEIKNLGGEQVTILNRAVSFEGNLECLYKVNLWSRTALRILKPIAQFSAHNETVLYKRVRRIDWTKIFSLDQTFAVDSTINSDLFPHSKYVALKVKDAIVDLFRLKHKNRRPSIDTKAPDYLLHVHCLNNNFTISLDSSGESLHKRGYRQTFMGSPIKSSKMGRTSVGSSGRPPAPLNEILAAGMISLAGWKGEKPLLDPMCGSGTILIEAIMIAQNVPPRMNRDKFSFMNWEDYDSKLWMDLKVQAIEGKEKINTEIIGYDNDPVQVKQTQSLLNRLGYGEMVKIGKFNFIDSIPHHSNGVIVVNPPYGERMGKENIGLFYSQIGDTLKKNYSGWEAWIISSNKNALKSIGLHPSKKCTLYNGALECKYQKFEMYKGSKKIGQV